MSNPTNIAQVNFDPKRRQAYQRVANAPGVYKDPRNFDPKVGPYYERPTIEGTPTWRKLASTTKTEAAREVATNRLNQRKALKGLAVDPYARSSAARIAELLDLYTAAGCPKARSTDSRSDKGLKEEKAIVERLRKWWGKKPNDTIALEDCRAYRDWRAPQIRVRAGGAKFSGGRMIDRELITLSNVFRWAMRNSRRTGVSTNPIAVDREKFHNAKTVEHCWMFQPSSGDELHALAAFLFQTPKSEVLGWQALYEAMVGQRTHEILALRRDAKNELQAGFVRENQLFLDRSTTTKGTFPYVEIHPALRECMKAHFAWLDDRYPDSPWFFPSHLDPMKPVGVGSLTHRLRKIAPAMGLPKRTSHGLRAFCVNAYRSIYTADGVRKYSDAEIALRIGHETGGKLIVTTYGHPMQYKITWLPAKKGNPPAWSYFTPRPKPAALCYIAPLRPIQMNLFEPTLIQTELPI